MVEKTYRRDESSSSDYLLWVIIRKDDGRKPADGELFSLFKNMSKNLSRYYQAWVLRQQGETFKEIGEAMKVSRSRTNQLVHFIEGKIKYKKPISNELKKLIKKFY